MTNNGPSVANDVNVTDTFDSNTTYVSSSITPSSVNGNTMTFDVGALSTGVSATITVDTTVSNTAWTDNDKLTDQEDGSATWPLTKSYDLLNNVSVTAITNDPNNENNKYYQPTNVKVPQAPHLSQTKSGKLDMTVINPSDRTDIGDKVDYIITVTNDGNVPLTGVTVSDTKAGTLTYTWPGEQGTLAVGQSVVCTGSYIITAEDISAGNVHNVATADSEQTEQVDTQNDVAIPQAPTPTSQICPTETTCDQYMNGQAGVLTQANYLVNKGTIKSVSPGVMFYYSTITIVSDGTVSTISVDQSNNGDWPVMTIQDTKQVILYDSNCNKISGTTVNVEGSKVTLTTKNKEPLSAGTYYLGIKYSLSSLQGITPTTPKTTYTFVTSVEGTAISSSKASIDLIPK